MNKKYTIDDVRNAFLERGYTLLSDSYTRGDIKLEFICNKHKDMGIQRIDFHHFLHRRQGCIYCSKEKPNKKRISDDELQKMCEQKSFQFIDSFTKNGQTNIHIICNNHIDKGIQSISLASLKQCKGCKYCSGKLRTTEDFKKIIQNIHPNIEILGEYTKAQNRIKCNCLIHNHIWNPTANALLNGEGCPICGKEKGRINSIKTNKQFTDELLIHNPNIYPIEEYKTAKEKIKFGCKICDYQWHSTPDQMLHAKYGCPRCAQNAVTLGQIKTNEEFLNELRSVNPDIEPLEEYKTDHGKILCRCTVHNYEWYVAPNKILRRRTGCPKCSMYHNEEIIADILDSLELVFKPQKKFDDCKDKNPLPFDFYLVDYNICIEYDGEQHYSPINFNGKTSSAEAFKKTQLHDKIKTEYCINNNIPLIRIPYWENKNLRGFLMSELNKYIPLGNES